MKQLVSALLIVLAVAGPAFADAAAALREIRGAESQLEPSQKRYEQARMYLERATKHLEGVDAATRAPIDQKIAELTRRARELELENWRNTAISEVERMFGFAERKLEDWNLRDTGVVDGVMSEVDRRLPEALTRPNAVESLTDGDKAGFQARRTELLEACKRKKIECHFHYASERIDRIERSPDMNPDSRASLIAEVDEQLAPANVPQDDPRVRQLKTRLEELLAAQGQASQAQAQAERIAQTAAVWEDKKRQFARECPAWEHEVVNLYDRWRQTSSLNVDKAVRRHAVAEEMLAHEQYKDVVQWFASDPAVVALVGEVATWRQEGATKVCAAANSLLDEVEQHAGDDGLAPALQGLLTLLEQRTPGAAESQATIARTRALLVSAGGTPTGGPTDAEGAEAPDAEGATEGSGGFLKVVLGLMCCFGFLVGVGGVGFVVYKQLNAAKPPAAS